MSDTKTIVETHTILRGVVGSTAHGTAIEGQDDRDEMGIFVEPPVKVMGLTSLDHYIQRDQPEGVRSRPGDLDLTMYSLRKFCRLASKGNPSVLALLYLPEYEIMTVPGSVLLGGRACFRGSAAADAFLGYLVQQRKRLTGERSGNVSRPELVEKCGYDTKYAMHALRLGYQGIEYLTKGHITLPVPAPQLDHLRAVREGKVDYEEALRMIQSAEDKLKSLARDFDVEPDLKAINWMLVEMHKLVWEMIEQEGDLTKWKNWSIKAQ